MRNITEIIIHCSDSDFGDAEIIDGWHKDRGWDGIGYHIVILNGIRIYAHKYAANIDGWIERGRPYATIGAHCRGFNESSIGICLIGKYSFTSAQLFEALPNTLMALFNKFNLSPKRVFGHREFNKNKTCPNFNMVEYRKYLEMRWIEENTG